MKQLDTRFEMLLPAATRHELGALSAKTKLPASFLNCAAMAVLPSRNPVWAQSGRDRMSALVQSGEPQPELGPAMRALSLRWQKAVTALFLTKGNRTAALPIAGYKAKPNSMNVLASRIFADDRVRAAVREVAGHMIEIAEPELLATTLDIMRDTDNRAADRLAAVRIVWDRANPVMTKHKVEVEHHLSSDELDVQHYRALQKIGAPQEAFMARFGHNGMARVQAMILAEEAKQKQIESSAGVVEGEFEEVETTE